MATVYDAVDAANLPTDGDGYLAYADGDTENVAAVQAVAKGRPMKLITTQDPGDLNADIFDTEPGNPPPSVAAAWAASKIRDGKGRPTIYCFTDLGPAGYTLSGVRAAVVAEGLSVDDVDYIVTDDDGDGVIPAGCVGKQFDCDIPPGYDVSIVTDTWLNPVPQPTPKPTEVIPMAAPLVLVGQQIHGAHVDAFGVLVHDWYGDGDPLSEPLSGKGAKASNATGASFVAQDCPVQIIGNTILVSALDTTYKRWFFSQTIGTGTWTAFSFPDAG